MAISFSEEVDDFPLITTGNPFTHGQTVSGMIRRGLSSIEENDRDGRIYASQAAVCARQAVLSSTRHDHQVQTAANSTYYALGNAIEDLVMKGLMKEGALFFREFRLPDVGLNLGGYIDGIIMVGGRIRVLEVKSCGELPAHPKLEHQAQAMVYSAITGLPPTLLYFSRSVADFSGTLKIREFALTPSIDEVKSTLFQVAYAREAIDAGIIPEIPAHFTGEKNCGWCPWKSHCWNGEPLPRPVVSPDQHVDLVTKAKARVDALTDPDAMTRRRNGVLRHVSKHGYDAAKEALAGDWSTFLLPD